ncbi:MAG: ribonuclease P protein component [Verrucomicrobiales bacterium]|nr:ribonuclease P protein component [Verrucomicrobiales bacterium]|tara:strand:+ start:688 stop:1068 length:381 start_codon:yes stop_codon:yes gene_type:complete
MPDALQARLTLGRDKRLLKRGEFARIKTEGRRLVRGCLVVNWMVCPDSAVSRLGAITSKAIGNAIKRSRARRLMREVFRHHQHEFTQPIELVLIARRSINEKDFQQVERTFLKLMSEAGVLAAREE